MNTRSFTVVDESHTAAGSSLQSLCTQIEEAIQRYTNILDSVTTEAAKAGHTTERYKSYVAMISELSTNFARLGKTLNQAANNYVAEINDADNYLY